MSKAAGGERRTGCILSLRVAVELRSWGRVRWTEEKGMTCHAPTGRGGERSRDEDQAVHESRGGAFERVLEFLRRDGRDDEMIAEALRRARHLIQELVEAGIKAAALRLYPYAENLV